MISCYHWLICWSFSPSQLSKSKVTSSSVLFCLNNPRPKHIEFIIMDSCWNQKIFPFQKIYIFSSLLSTNCCSSNSSFFRDPQGVLWCIMFHLFPFRMFLVIIWTNTDDIFTHEIVKYSSAVFKTQLFIKKCSFSLPLFLTSAAFIMPLRQWQPGLGHLSHYCECNTAGSDPEGSFFKFGNIHSDSGMNWLDFGGKRSKVDTINVLYWNLSIRTF